MSDQSQQRLQQWQGLKSASAWNDLRGLLDSILTSLLEEAENEVEALEAFSIVLRTLAEHAPDIERLVVHQQIITPRDLEATFGLTGGHILHGEPSLDQLFTMRPVLGCAQYRTPIRNLYMCGSATHPGGGIMGAPGLNAARTILSDWKRRKI